LQDKILKVFQSASRQVIRMWPFKKTDPVCGMKEIEGKGMLKDGKWFCSDDCLRKYEAHRKKEMDHAHGGCCGH